MTFYPDLKNPSDGNQMLRSGAGKSYQEKWYDLNLLDVDAVITPLVGSERPRGSLDISGNLILHGGFSLNGALNNSLQRLFTIGRDFGGSTALSLSGVGSAGFTWGSHLKDVTLEVSPLNFTVTTPSGSSENSGYASVFSGQSIVTTAAGDLIVIDGIVIRPEPSS